MACGEKVTRDGSRVSIRHRTWSLRRQSRTGQSPSTFFVQFMTIREETIDIKEQKSYNRCRSPETSLLLRFRSSLGKLAGTGVIAGTEETAERRWRPVETRQGKEKGGAAATPQQRLRRWHGLSRNSDTKETQKGEAICPHFYVHSTEMENLSVSVCIIYWTFEDGHWKRSSSI
jgi:hypothetical protein